MLRRLTLLLLIGPASPAIAQVPGQDPGLVPVPQRLSPAEAEPLFIGALADLHHGDPARAATRLSDVLTAYPEDPVVLDALAEAYHKQGMTPEALYHAELAAAAAPDDAPILRRLAAIYEASGDVARAQQTREAAQRIDPASSVAEAPPPSPARPEAGTPATRVTELPGRAAYRAGRYAEAADALLAVVDADPRQLEAWPLVLDALARTADPRAGDTADLALLLFPTVPSVLVPAAEAFASAGRSGDAREAAESALRALDGGTDDPALRQRADAVLSSLR